MPSFDVVSRTDLAEVDNALNGVAREIKQRFDLANTKCAVVRSDDSLTLTADDNMKMTQVEELLKKYLAMRKVELGALDWGEPQASVYGERIQAAARVIRESLPKAPGPEVVARAVHRALTARRPRVRYAVGAESRLVPLGRRLFPDRLMLRFIRDHFRV